jgi:hypothetical protein
MAFGAAGFEAFLALVLLLAGMTLPGSNCSWQRSGELYFQKKKVSGTFKEHRG